MSPNESPVPLNGQLAIVDDDAAVLKSLSRMLTAWGYNVSAFPSAEAFAESLNRRRPDALLMDLRLPGTDGLALLEDLSRQGHRIPTVFLSGHADVPTSVRAIRAGAVDFLEKPCDEMTLLGSLARAFDKATHDRALRTERDEDWVRWCSLTPRERQVCLRVVLGDLNKQIGALLEIKEKTVKVHRKRVMDKMGVTNLPQLVRKVDGLGDLVFGDIPARVPMVQRADAWPIGGDASGGASVQPNA